MPSSEQQGCLVAILKPIVAVLKLFGKNISVASAEDSGDDKLPPVEQLPYRRQEGLLSAAELSFYRVLLNCLDGSRVVCPKVRLGDVFSVPNVPKSQTLRNKIDRKHIDFVICDAATMRLLCGIELDDKSHSRSDRQERDEFVERVFRDAGLPLLRIPAAQGYNVAALREQFETCVAEAKVVAPSDAGSSESSLCPKCGIPMVERPGKFGPFLGCPNYPRCREKRPLPK